MSTTTLRVPHAALAVDDPIFKATSLDYDRGMRCNSIIAGLVSERYILD